MSGPFQRIVRRGSDRPDEDPPREEHPAAGAGEPDGHPATGGGEPEAPTQQTAALDPVDQPTEQTAALDPATLGEQPTTVKPSAGEPASAAPDPAAAQPTTVQPAAGVPGEAPPEPRRPGFRERGQLRRRLRYLRKLRELQVRDLGGLVFDLRRFERKRDDLVAQKIDQIRACDDELRAIEVAIEERRDLRDVREPGIGGTCPRCFAIYGSTDRFCGNCGAALGGAVQGPAQVPAPPPQPPTPAPGAPGAAATPQ
jgi:hypothetical protein